MRIRKDITICGSKKMTDFGVRILAPEGSFLALERNFYPPGPPLYSRDNNNIGLF